jgi:hypothetical protein
MKQALRWKLVLPLLALALAAVLVLRVGSGSAMPEGGSIHGVVEGRAGPEAGVWVIAETADLDTHFIKIVVTDDDGRFLLPDLPGAGYSVWVRGYGLRDSSPRAARPGDELRLAAEYPATPQEAAHVYPANYWMSLIDVPRADEFPGTGPEGNGISPGMRFQEQWVDQMKQGCQLCHQLGNQLTREVSHIQDRFATTREAWEHRVSFGQRGTRMNGMLAQMGRDRAIEMFADWTDRIAAGEVPPQPPRPQGRERDLVITMWDWGHAYTYAHDEITTDKRNPLVNAGGPVYGVSMSDDKLLIVDPNTHEARELQVPVRDSDTPSYFPLDPFEPSPFWGDEAILNAPANVHNPMLDHLGRVWMTSSIRHPNNNPEWCLEGSGNPYAENFPLRSSGRQASFYDPATDSFTLIDTCFGTHHLQFAEDEDHTLYFSGDGNVIGWIHTRVFDETGDEQLSQGWCPTVVDTNGDGRITSPWNEPRGTRNPARDTRFSGFAYGIIPDPVNNAVWIARAPAGVPGSIVRLEIGDDPPRSCAAEVYEPPFGIEDIPRSEWGFGPRGIDITRDGVVWTALSGSGHFASFDRRRCAATNGPDATGQHCPEGWTLHRTPGPGLRNVESAGSGDHHYYNWVDQFNTLGLGEDTPIANGTTSDALLALDPESGEWVILRVPYPLGFYTRGLDGRIDDPDAGWKGRALWATFGTGAPWHLEGGQGTKSKVVKFQLRPHPLAE